MEAVAEVGPPYCSRYEGKVVGSSSATTTSCHKRSGVSFVEVGAERVLKCCGSDKVGLVWVKADRFSCVGRNTQSGLRLIESVGEEEV